jgi:DNA-binding MarR family transcriptional regulator
VFNQSTRTITRAITRLSERGYIKVSFEYEGKQISKRIIKIALPMDKKVMGSIDKNVDNPIDKNVRDNNTSNNNTSINIYVRDEEDFQRFWDKLQGRKKNKNDAKRAYLQIDAEISAEELASKFNQLLNTREEKYVPYPQKWLKNEGWLEEVKEESTSNAFMSDTGVYRDVDGYIISKEEYEKLQN